MRGERMKTEQARARERATDFTSVREIDLVLEPQLDRLVDGRADGVDLENICQLTLRRNVLTVDTPVTVAVCPPDRVPVIGDWIYVRTSAFIEHGIDDVAGGLAQVIEVSQESSGGEDCFFVSTRQHGNRGGTNWTQFAAAEQERWAERFGNTMAHVNPDWG